MVKKPARAKTPATTTTATGTKPFKLLALSASELQIPNGQRTALAAIHTFMKTAIAAIPLVAGGGPPAALFSSLGTWCNRSYAEISGTLNAPATAAKIPVASAKTTAKTRKAGTTA